MQSPICALLGIEFPLLAFSHCRDVVVAVSKAGGMGVFGAAALPPERLEEELAWIDAHIGGRHDLALAVNGRIATLAQTFPWEGKERFSAFVPPEVFRAGRNAVDVLLVPRAGPPMRLTRAD